MGAWTTNPGLQRTARRAAVCFVALFAALPAARAQVTLPRVPTPNLPVDLPVDFGKTVDGVTSALDPKELQNVRLLRVRELLRRHGDVLEADPDGAPMRRAEVIAIDPTEELLAAARSAGFVVLRETDLVGLDSRIVVFRVPDNTSTARALKKLRALDPSGEYDFNHVYLESGDAPSEAGAPTPPAA